MPITYIITETGDFIDTETGNFDLITEDSTPGTAVEFEDKITMGMRFGTQQADVVMGGFG